jgi:hypothetical protein
MGGLVQTVGNGIVGLVSGAFDAIGAVLRDLVGAGDRALPGGILWVVIFIVAVIGAWTLAKR